MQTSEQINEIAAALAKAQGKMENPDKESLNPHFNRHYASLASGINAVRDALAENGLSIIQTTCMNGDLLELKTRLCHASGQWIEGVYPICKFPTAPQQMGAAMTYARRYSMFAIVGIAPEDDDGESAAKSDIHSRQNKAPLRQEQPQARQEPEYDFPGDQPGLTPAQEYVKLAIQVLDEWTSNVTVLKEWWDDEKSHRDAAGVINPSPEYTELFEAYKHRGMSIAGKVKPKRAA